MNEKCLFCKKTKNPRRLRYCSDICIKRAWYFRKYPNSASFFNESKEFWGTSTGIGFTWEKYVADLLGATHLTFNKNGADLNWNGKLVDVKSCNLYKRKFKRGKKVLSEQSGVWVFNRNKPKKVDFFFCVALKDNVPFKKLLIPFKYFPKKGLVIGFNSKYDKFEFK